MLEKTAPAVTWEITINGKVTAKLTFHSDGRASDGATQYTWSWSESGDVNYPHVFIAQEEMMDNPYRVYQVYSAMFNNVTGVGLGWVMEHGDLPTGAGKLQPFSMKKMS